MNDDIKVIKALLENFDFKESTDFEDAQRYRWLRKNGGVTYSDPLGSGGKAKGILYDIAVDAEMRK